jgi:predicted SnoaL-like aldol condensation-catalyzing enzyme
MTEIGKSSRREAAVSFLRLVVAGKIHEAYATFVRPDMRHHNMAFPGDAASLEKAMEENNVQYPHKVLDVKRTLEDGNLVAVHSHVRLRKNERGFAAVHIFRFEGDRIAEMWDIGQPVPADSPNTNGMF